MATILSEFGDIVRAGVPLAPKTWFHLGGPAELFVEPRSVEELQAVVRRCHESGTSIHLLGAGSNLLVRDEGVKGVVLALTDPVFARLEPVLDGFRAGGGASLANTISSSVRAGLAGLEPLVGIPGTVGGALHGNSGSRGADVGQWVSTVTALDRKGEIVQRRRDELVFAYRESSVDELAILDVVFRLEPEDADQLTKRMQKQWIVKKAAQPMTHQRTGCLFRNPRGMSAGMLIEQAGLSGASVGGAEISQRHCNFVIANDTTTSTDVLKLIDLVRSRVAERLGVELDLQLDIW